MLIAVPLGLVIGLVVGTVGGGGAILALPVLVYVLGEPVGPASTASLIVVALAAAVGGGSLARGGLVCWRIALTFSVPAAVGSLAGAVANTQVSGPALILAFVPVMLAAAAATWYKAGAEDEQPERDCPRIDRTRTLIAGLLVGTLTGFFGVGGGFLIVPVLTLLLGVGLRRAAATSLVVIFLTGLAALASHLATGAAPALDLTALLAGAAAAGALCGSLIAERLPQRALGRAFAVVVTLMAIFLAVDTLLLGGPPGG
ncbi:MAG: sulfite exporter TauE/SafE family protein [Actinomycetota bacterium]|nr:sulfite exporter TauE/SafE family protein [Actinomycetota bacterium]